jgi:hypothetical protein
VGLKVTVESAYAAVPALRKPVQRTAAIRSELAFFTIASYVV